MRKVAGFSRQGTRGPEEESGHGIRTYLASTPPANGDECELGPGLCGPRVPHESQ